MSDLPVEIWENIISYLQPSDLANVCLTSKLLNVIATKILYRHVTLDVEYTSVYAGVATDDCLRWRWAMETIIFNERKQADAVRVFELNCIYYVLEWTPPSPSCEPWIDEEVNTLILMAIMEMSRLEEFIWNSNLPLTVGIMTALARKPIKKFTMQDYPNRSGQSSIAPLIGCPFTSLSLDANIIQSDQEFSTLFMSVRDTLRHLKLWRGIHDRRTDVFKPVARSGKKLALVSLECVAMTVLDVTEVMEAVDTQTLRSLHWVPFNGPNVQLLWTYLQKNPPTSLKSLTTDMGDETLAELLRCFSGLETLSLNYWGRSILLNLEWTLETHCTSLRYLRLPHDCDNGKAYLSPRALRWLMENCVNLEELSCAMDPKEMRSFMLALKPAKRLRLIHVTSNLCRKNFLWGLFDILRPEQTALFDTLQVVGYVYRVWKVRDTHDVRDNDPIWQTTMKETMASVVKKEDTEARGPDGEVLSMAYVHDLCCRAVFKRENDWELALSCHGKTPVEVKGHRWDVKQQITRWKLCKWLVYPDPEPRIAESSDEEED